MFAQMDYVIKLGDTPWKFVGGALAALATFLFPTPFESKLAAAVFALVWIDMLSAIIAVAQSEGKQAIQSSKLGRTITKISAYSLCVITAAIATQTVGADAGWQGVTVSFALGAMAVRELKSIKENFDKAGFDFFGPKKEDN